MSASSSVPFAIEMELPGWELFWALIETDEQAGKRTAPLLRETSELARASLEGIDLASHATVSAVRKLFRAAGAAAESRRSAPGRCSAAAAGEGGCRR